MPYIYGKKQKIGLKAYIIHILKSLTLRKYMVKNAITTSNSSLLSVSKM